MKGLLEDFVGVLQARNYGPADVIRLAQTCLSSFTPGQLPVLNQLAKHYAVCDDWFASVPSQTNPNRAFLMCGTSNGMVNNGELETNPQARAIEKILGMGIGDDRFDAPTIFNALSSNQTDWTVFWQTSYLPQKMYTLLTGLPILIPALTLISPPLGLAAATFLALLKPYTDYLEELTSGEVTSCYTWRLFPQIEQKISGAAQHFQKIEDFHRRARAGLLPAFSYIEPFWTISHTTNDNRTYEKLVATLGNDYHPPSNLLVGEQFVKDVYTSLISNRAAWTKTLLLITFDEFVGTFDSATDRLQSGTVTPPWGQGPAPYPIPSGFTFDRLGARVPTILISPYVQKNTVFRSTAAVPYDHTSVIATTLKWSGHSDQVGQFGARAAAAPTFDQVPMLTQPRTDEAALAFLDTPKAIGDPVPFGASFVLKNQSGDYLSTFYTALKVSSVGAVIPDSLLSICVDLDLAAYFPTVGGSQPSVLSFVTQAADQPAQISNNAQVMIVSREPGLGARNILGAWAIHDCYYYDEYFDGENAPKEQWIVQKLASSDQPVRYGDQVYLVSVSAAGQRLTRDTTLWISNGYVTTAAGGDYWTIEPAPAQVSWAPQPWQSAPPLAAVAAAQQGGPRGAQLWGIDTTGTLRSTYQETPGGQWSAWSGVWNGASPASLLSITAAEQNNAMVRIWAVDQGNALYSNAQTAPGGNWTGWSPAGWNGAPPLRSVAAAQQGGSRGAQLWGIDTNGQLRSTYQETPGGQWSAWSGVWNGASPASLLSITAAEQNNGMVRIWAVDAANILYSNAQTSPGGDWTGWSPPGEAWNGAPALRSVAAAQQGGSRGAQLWGITTAGQLVSTYQETPGGQWSAWSGVWNGDSPGQLISITAAQQNDGTVRVWALDAANTLHSNAQTSPGGNWTGWTS